MRKTAALMILLALPAIAHAEITDEDLAIAEAWLEANLEGTSGQEFGGRTFEADTGSFIVTGEVIGAGFCAPPDPTVTPNPNPTPPNNAWGCVNDVTTSSTRVTAGAILSVSVPVLFIDFSTSRPELTLCGDCFPPLNPCSGTVERGGYAIATTATLSAIYEEVSGPGGRELVPIDGTQVVTLGNTTFTLADGCLATLLGIANYFDELEALLIEALESQPLPSIPLPDQVAVEDSTWGRIKAIYSN